MTTASWMHMKKTSLAVCGLIFFFSGLTHAAMTEVGPASLDPAGNLLIDRLQGIYGSLHSGGINAESMDLGGTTFYRLNDDNASPTDLSAIPDTSLNMRSGDKIWTDGRARYEVELLIAADSSVVGIDQSSLLTPLVDSMGTNDTMFEVSGPFEFYLENTTIGSIFRSGDSGSSVGTSGSSPKDQMITWFIDDGGRANWLLAWEDRLVGEYGFPDYDDRDYQDFVVQVSVVPLPSPAGMTLALFGLMGIAYFVRNRRRIAQR